MFAVHTLVRVFFSRDVIRVFGRGQKNCLRLLSRLLCQKHEYAAFFFLESPSSYDLHIRRYLLFKKNKNDGFELNNIRDAAGTIVIGDESIPICGGKYIPNRKLANLFMDGRRKLSK